ncbi:MULTISPECIES: 5'-nucleotidase [Pandoraea]|jgi:5'-nucleotidase|uniref:5'-nucleotidase n=2 Tax=Pandoraea TaxID=93217 RepID=A0A378YTT3_9BURK|nr:MULTISPECIES: 5'-nucleotidase [Pandoraea]AHB07306.1 5'-nucleotidase [Pandoraea pnomenusa 3kgm]AHB76502.1 5'-nucleotidase [Pandoraea pnomenusa]AHN75173.1 5'-nucleotidase [Pandoraea pnomenusa]AIU28244.1 5'-nucleotidase [Pandoraea pnomenusa]ANC45365.1 5'-nucleotidase [Pandoraea pnomenusa]
MPITLENKLVVAISSRALFDFEEENRVYEAGVASGDDQSYMRYQLDRLDVPARIGVAFPLVQKLLAFNQDGTDRHRVEVVVLSRNDPVSGMRVFRSARQVDLKIERGVFTRGREPFGYLNALGAHLFLSANERDVRSALTAGFPAARVYPDSAKKAELHPDEIRIAFDGDAVLFSDEAEQVFQRNGLDAFQRHEIERAATPLPPGPFKPLLQALHRLQTLAGHEVPVKIRTALVTARSAPAHERAIRTLMDWKIDIDEAMFLGGLDKGAFLREFEPDFFFDDQTRHCESAARVTPTGHVISGIANHDNA